METTLSIGVAILFGVFGLALAVMLACVIYREGSPRPESEAGGASSRGEAEPV